MRYAAHYQPTGCLALPRPAERPSSGTGAATVGKIHSRYGIAGRGLTLWAASCTAIVGAGLVHASPTTLALLINPAVIAVDQDPGEHAGHTIAPSSVVFPLPLSPTTAFIEAPSRLSGPDLSLLDACPTRRSMMASGEYGPIA
jgi:hypothetical protein